MADYFAKFSLVLKLDGPQQEYAMDLATEASRHLSDNESVPSDFPADLVPVLEDWSFETEKENDGIWLYSDNGGIDAACLFIQHLLQKFDPKGRVALEWSNDCSKPRVDAYGGGAAVITTRKIESMNTSQWVREQIALL
jgi:hypothetical protein